MCHLGLLVAGFDMFLMVFAPDIANTHLIILKHNRPTCENCFEISPR